jgi:hypothetical protein
MGDNVKSLAKTNASKGGRPSSYRPEFADEVADYMSDGHSLMAWAWRQGLPYETVWDWFNQYPDFQCAVYQGRGYRLEKIENKLNDPKITGTAARVNMFLAQNIAPHEYGKIGNDNGDSSKNEMNRFGDLFAKMLGEAIRDSISGASSLLVAESDGIRLADPDRAENARRIESESKDVPSTDDSSESIPHADDSLIRTLG